MTRKQQAMQAIERLPDSASLEDIIETICLRARVEEGLEDARQGRVVTDDPLAKEIEQWPRR